MKHLVDITTASELLTLGMVWEATSPRPTLDEAANWLREAKGLHVRIEPTKNWTGWDWFIDKQNSVGNCNPAMLFDTHSEALSAAISHALKMIKGL